MPYGPGPFFVRMRLLAFEIAIVGIILTQAVVGLAGGVSLDPVSDLLPAAVAIGFRVLYLAAGLFMLVGLVFHRGDFEGAGLTLLMALLAIRGFLFGYLLGWDAQSWTAVTFSAFLIFACAARLSLIVWSAKNTPDPDPTVVAGIELETPGINPPKGD